VLPATLSDEPLAAAQRDAVEGSATHNSAMRPEAVLDAIARSPGSASVKAFPVAGYRNPKNIFSLSVLLMISFAHAGPMNPGQACTAGNPQLGCKPGIYCLNKDGSPAFAGGGKCYPPGVALGTYEPHSPTAPEIANWTAVQFLGLGKGIQA
jgi:hypothetical protein